MAAEIRIGTRGSPLALAQAREVAARLGAAFPHLAPEGAIAIDIIRTTGDKMQSGPLADLGGKGLFTKEIEEALAAGAIDMAVHSMKDVPTELPEGLKIVCVLPREDPRDGFISAKAHALDALPKGAVLGTSSLRRRAQALHRRPDLKVIEFRGNVETRLNKLNAGQADATLLAMAGLNRLGKAALARAALAPEEMLPAVCQGVIGLECRAGDTRIASLLAPLNHTPTAIAATAERALLAALDGSCRTPIAALAEINGDRLRLRAQIVTPDGAEMLETERSGPLDAAATLGADAGEELKSRGGARFIVPS